MSIADVDAVLAPVSDASPAGLQIQYAEDAELELLAARIPERAIGAENEPGAQRLAAIEPDWQQVEARARDLLSKSKDIRFAVLLARALCNQRGVIGLNAGLAVVRELLSRYWDKMYPAIDDIDTRMNQLSSLFDAENLKADLRERVFFRMPGVGVVLVRDVEAVLGRYPARVDAPPLSAAQITHALSALDLAEREALDAGVRGALEQVEALAMLLTEKGQSGIAADTSGLTQILRSLAQVMPHPVAEVTPQPVAEVTCTESNAVMVSGQSPLSRRNEILRMLDTVCEYLERHEPSNPAPLLIKRAKTLVGKDFIAIIQDLAPGGLDQVRNLAGIRD